MHEHELVRNAVSKGEVLLVCTSCSKLVNDDDTGIWLSEVAVPYCVFRSAGFDVTICSPQGGKVPVDPASLKYLPNEGEVTAGLVRMFQADETAHQMMEHSVPIDKVEHVTPYSALFLAGGHGATCDFPSTARLQHLVRTALHSGLVVAAVCHGVAVFASEQLGKMVAGRHVTAFSDEEERAVARESDVPFLVESRLRELGLNVEIGAAGVEHVVTDGNIMTGQNPASAGKLAREVVAYLKSHVPPGPASHPGSLTAEEVPLALGVDPLLPGYGSRSAPGPDTDVQVSKDVTEPSLSDNLGSNAGPNPGTFAGNDTGASG